MRPASIRTRLRQWRTHIATDIDRLRGFPTLRRRFRRSVGYELNLENPRSMSEKMQWRKVYDRNPLFPILLDKVRMPEWARSMLPEGDHHCRANYRQVARRAEDLDFAALPDDVALKCNHGSGWNVLLRAGVPFDEVQVRRQLNRWLGRKFGKLPDMHEWGYLGIPPRIAVQDLLLQPDGTLANDMRFHIFGDDFGFLHMRTTDAKGVLRVGHYDSEFRPLEVRSHREPPDRPNAKPQRFDDMLRIARSLGRHLDYVRVDFLTSGDKICLNELTLCHNSGLVQFDPREFDDQMGDLWQLPRRRG